MRGSLGQLTKRLVAGLSGNLTTQARAFNMVPMVLERSQSGERAFDLYSRLLKEGIIFVNGPVNDQMSALITAQLLFLESEGAKKPVSGRAIESRIGGRPPRRVVAKPLSLLFSFALGGVADQHVH